MGKLLLANEFSLPGILVRAESVTEISGEFVILKHETGW